MPTEPTIRDAVAGELYVVRSNAPIKITQTTALGTLVMLDITDECGTNGNEVCFTAINGADKMNVTAEGVYAITRGRGFNRGAASAQGSAEKIDVDQDYTPESTNPQSGTAVAQALGGYATTQALEERTVVTEVHGSELEDTSQMEGYSISSMTSILGGGNLMPYLTLTKVIVTNNQTCPEDALVQSLRMVVFIPSSGTPGRVYLVPKHNGQGLIGLSTSGNRQSLVGKVYYESPLLTPGGTSELVEVEFLPAGELAPVSWFSTSLWPCTGETAESVLGGAGDKSVAPRLAMQPYSQGNKLKEGYDAYFTFSLYPTRSYTPIKLITGKPLTEAVPAHTDDTTAHLTAKEHAGLTELLENTTGSGGGGAGEASSRAYDCWVVLAFGGTDIISCTGNRYDMFSSIREIINLDGGTSLVRMKLDRAYTLDELVDALSTAQLAMGGMSATGANAGYVPIGPYIPPAGTEW